MHQAAGQAPDRFRYIVERMPAGVLVIQQYAGTQSAGGGGAARGGVPGGRLEVYVNEKLESFLGYPRRLFSSVEAAFSLIFRDKAQEVPRPPPISRLFCEHHTAPPVSILPSSPTVTCPAPPHLRASQPCHTVLCSPLLLLWPAAVCRCGRSRVRRLTLVPSFL